MTTWIGALLLLTATAAPADPGVLLDQLRRGTAAERRAAAMRLGEIGDAAAITDLAQALRDPDAEVRARAQAAL